MPGKTVNAFGNVKRAVDNRWKFFLQSMEFFCWNGQSFLLRGMIFPQSDRITIKNYFAGFDSLSDEFLNQNYPYSFI